MSSRLIFLSCAVVVLAAASAPALADPETLASVPTYELYINGGGEVDGLLEQAIARIAKLDDLDPSKSSLTEYITSDGNHRLYVFRTSSGSNAPSPLPASLSDPNLGVLSNVPDGTVVAIHKASVGGSIQCTASVANRTVPPKWIKANQISPAGTTASVKVLTTVGASSTITFQKITFSAALGAGNVESRRPDVCMSNVEPAAFVGRTSATVTNPDGSTIAAFTVLKRDVNAVTGVVPIADLVTGMVVTKALRNALQHAQGLIPGSELEADLPSLTAPQINALYTQAITDWGDFRVGAQGLPLTQVAGVSAPAQSKVFVVRRDLGAGTQITTEGYFTQGVLNWAPGTAGDSATGLATVPTGPYVFSGSTTGANQNTLKILQAGNIWAIGLISTEKPNLNITNSPTDRTNAYRFIRVNGASPSLVNVVNGSYPATWCTNSVVYNTNYLKTRPVGTQYLAGALARGLNNPGLLGPVDENLQVNLISGDPASYWGGGFLTSTPSVDTVNGSAYVPSTAVPTAAGVLANPINPNSKQISGTLKSVGPSVLLYPSPQ